MKIKHFYSDVCGTQVNEPRLHVPSMPEVKLAIANGKVIKPEYSIFSDGSIVEVRRTQKASLYTQNIYRDMYTIIK